MWLIVGLGNPGKKYAGTRHNLGFMVVEAIARHWKLSFSASDGEALTARGRFRDAAVLLAKPQTYMNRSGSALAALMERYQVATAELLVIFDDLDLPLGRLRIRTRGRSGGHRGVQSVLDTLGTDRFLRLRLGIREPSPYGEAEDYVLSKFSAEVQPLVEQSVDRAVAAVEAIARDGVAKAMSLFNRSEA